MNDDQHHHDEHGEAGMAPVAPNDSDAATVVDGLFAIASAIELLTEAVSDGAWRARLS
jgi:hypothetical protein